MFLLLLLFQSRLDTSVYLSICLLEVTRIPSIIHHLGQADDRVKVEDPELVKSVRLYSHSPSANHQAALSATGYHDGVISHETGQYFYTPSRSDTSWRHIDGYPGTNPVAIRRYLSDGTPLLPPLVGYSVCTGSPVWRVWRV